MQKKNLVGILVPTVFSSLLVGFAIGMIIGSATTEKAMNEKLMNLAQNSMKLVYGVERLTEQRTYLIDLWNGYMSMHSIEYSPITVESLDSVWDKMDARDKLYN